MRKFDLTWMPNGTVWIFDQTLKHGAHYSRDGKRCSLPEHHTEETDAIVNAWLKHWNTNKH